MCASYLLPFRVVSNYSKLCGSKLNNFSAFHLQNLPKIFTNAVALSRTSSSLASHDRSRMWQQGCLHPVTSRQHKSSWPESKSYNSSVLDTEVEAESDKKPVARSKRDSMRRDRIENQTVFREIVAQKGDDAWTDADWVHVAESLQFKNSDLWDVICMHTLYLDKNISVARSLMTYLEKHGTKPSLIILTFYIGLLGETSSTSEDQQKETYKHYQHLLSQTDLLDAASIEILISGLSMTKYYKECVKLLQICQETSNPSPSSLVKILRAGLRNKDTKICQLALAVIEDKVDATSLNSHVPQVIDDCLAVDNQYGLEMFMNFMQKHKILLQRHLLESITESFNRYQPNRWTGHYGHINDRNGCCTVCGHKMEKSEVKDKDFRAIQSAFLNQVIVGSNVFFKTTPEEMYSFIRFVKKKGPFDVVIDGLNVLYRASSKPNIRHLEKCVEFFTQQGLKTLLLGNMQLIKKIDKIKTLVPTPEFYFTSTTKADDAFFLYAALHSGKNTLIVSRDKLRDHKFLLEPKLRPAFHQWVLSAQIYDWYFNKFMEFSIGKRHLYILGPAKDPGGWHIPEMDVDSNTPFGNFSILCLRNNSGQAVAGNVAPIANGSDELTPSASKRSAFSQTKPFYKEHKQKNFARPSTDKADVTESPKRNEKKWQQSDNTRIKTDKEWFEN